MAGEKIEPKKIYNRAIWERAYIASIEGLARNGIGGDKLAEQAAGNAYAADARYLVAQEADEATRPVPAPRFEPNPPAGSRGDA